MPEPAGSSTASGQSVVMQAGRVEDSSKLIWSSETAALPNSGGNVRPLMPESTGFRWLFKLFFSEKSEFFSPFLRTGSQTGRLFSSACLKPPCHTPPGVGQSALCPRARVAASGVPQTMKLVPLGENVIVKRLDNEQTTPGGIVLPDSAQKKPQQGRVLSVGDGRLLPSGVRANHQVSEGDRVLFSRYSGTGVKIDGEELLIITESEILAVVN